MLRSYTARSSICCLYRDSIDTHLRHHLEFPRIREPSFLGPRCRLRSEQPFIFDTYHIQSPESGSRRLELPSRNLGQQYPARIRR
jgi:hypothetical protein